MRVHTNFRYFCIYNLLICLSDKTIFKVIILSLEYLSHIWNISLYIRENEYNSLFTCKILIEYENTLCPTYENIAISYTKILYYICSKKWR